MKEKDEKLWGMGCLHQHNLPLVHNASCYCITQTLGRSWFVKIINHDFVCKTSWKVLLWLCISAKSRLKGNNEPSKRHNPKKKKMIVNIKLHQTSATILPTVSGQLPRGATMGIKPGEKDCSQTTYTWNYSVQSTAIKVWKGVKIISWNVQMASNKHPI